MLIGSRDFRTEALLSAALDANVAGLPRRSELPVFAESCKGRLAPGDGFRRQAVPVLLYRYLRDVPGLRSGWECGPERRSFCTDRRSQPHDPRWKRFDIDTPSHLVRLSVIHKVGRSRSVCRCRLPRYWLSHGNLWAQSSPVIRKESNDLASFGYGFVNWDRGYQSGRRYWVSASKLPVRPPVA